MRNMWMVLGLALSLLVGCLADDTHTDDDIVGKGLGSSPDDAPDAGMPDKSLSGGKTLIGGVDKGAATSPVEANIIVPGCDAPPTDPYRVCEGNGGGGSGTGGGGGGGGGGSGGGSGGGGGTPSCPWGFDWSTFYNSCVFSLRYTTCGYRSGFQCSYTHLGSCECYNVGSPNPECDSSLDCPGSTYCGDLGLCVRAP